MIEFLSGFDGSLKINNTYQPTTVSNTFTNTYESHKLGVMICFSINAFIGNNGQMFDEEVQHPDVFTLRDCNVEQWAVQIAQTQAKFVVLTVRGEMGFTIYDSHVLNDQTPITIDGWTGDLPAYGPGIPDMTMPAFKKYDVGASKYADRNIVDKFCIAFRKRGIKIGFYYSIDGGYAHNARSFFDMEDNYPNYLNNLRGQMARQMQEMAMLYKPDYFWFDTHPNIETTPVQTYYDAIKTVSPDTLVIYNSYGAGDFKGYPYDIKSIEAYVDAPVGNPIWNKTQNYNGTNYYVPKELITTVCLHEQYFAINPEYVDDQPPYTQGLKSQSEIQGVYDKAKAAGATCLLSVYADRNGIIPAEQVELIKNIIL